MEKSKIVIIDNVEGDIEFLHELKKNEEVIIKRKNSKLQEEHSRSIKEMKEFIKYNEGDFINLIYKYGCPLMDKLQNKCDGNKSNIHIIRFMKLATYMSYGGKLYDDNRNEIKKSSLKKIWDTENRSGINETYELLIECDYIHEDDNGNIVIGNDLVVKGAMSDFKKLKREDSDLTYTRVFIDSIQKLYNATTPKNRKQIGNLFKILPFINYKHNVLCANPTETDMDNLIFLNWTDLARLCGYEDNKNVSRFKREMFKLKINDMYTIGQFITGNGYKLCVNPKVYYSGDCVEDLKALYKLF